MNPVVLAAVAISLLAVGAVSMSSLSAQQATSSAGVQKMALERDRLGEQVNAYISAVAAESSSTKATVKNTGSSPVTVDHCLALSPSSTLRPTAAKVAVGQTVSPGAMLDITLSGNVGADNIKCVTSKGTVLPVKLAAAAGDAMPDPVDYIDSFAVMADVVMASTQHFTNGAYTPWAKPSPPSQGKGSLTYKIPVSKPITVNYVTREAPDGTAITVVPDGSSVQYSAGQMISVPITGPTSKVIIKFTPQGSTEQLTASIMPNFVDVSWLTGNTKTSSGSAMIGVGRAWQVDPTYNRWYDAYVATYSGTASLIGAINWIYPPSAPLYCTGGSTSIDGKTHCSTLGTTIQSSPEIVQIYSFPAPKSTVKVTLYYDVNALYRQENCHISPCPSSMGATLDLGQGGVTSISVPRTDRYSTSCPYSNYCITVNDYYYEFKKSAPVTFVLTGLTPGQQVDIPVKLKADIGSQTSYRSAIGGGYYIAGAINYSGSVATQLFLD
jgi:hypothetical protein